jgi:hypothetical protein
MQFYLGIFAHFAPDSDQSIQFSEAVVPAMPIINHFVVRASGAALDRGDHGQFSSISSKLNGAQSSRLCHCAARSQHSSKDSGSS